LAQVSQTLCIRQTYLQAIEGGHFSELPGPTYAAGFVRAYAEHLGLDGEEMVRGFKAERSRTADQTELRFPSPMSEGGMPSGAVLLVGVFLALVAYGAWYVMSERDGFVAELISPLPERLAGVFGKPNEISEIVTQSSESDGPQFKSVEGRQAATLGNDRPRSDSLAYEEQSASQRQSRGSDEVASAASNAVTGSPLTTASDASGRERPTHASETEQRFGDRANMPADGRPAEGVEAQEANQTVVDTSSPRDNGAANVEGRQGGEADATAQDANTAAQAAEPETVVVDATAAGADGDPADGDSYLSNPSGQILGAAEGGRIVLRATSESWIQVRDGETGQPLFTGLLESGDVYRVPSVPGLRLTAGNAGGLDVMVDGQVAPSLGGDGVVRRNVLLEADRLRLGTVARE
jgi:cytoskeleton protein RodZ